MGKGEDFNKIIMLNLSKEMEKEENEEISSLFHLSISILEKNSTNH